MKNDQNNRKSSSIHLATGEPSGTPTGRFCELLAELAERLDRTHVFNKGQFVRWKPGLRNRKYPDYREPAIVRAMMPDPIMDPAECGSASPYFQEPLTLVIAAFEDNDLLEFRVDGRRFEPFANDVP